MHGFVPPYGCPDRASCTSDDQTLVGEAGPYPEESRKFLCLRCKREVRACPGSEGVSANWAEQEVERLRFYRWLYFDGEQPPRRRKAGKPATLPLT